MLGQNMIIMQKLMHSVSFSARDIQWNSHKQARNNILSRFRGVSDQYVARLSLFIERRKKNHAKTDPMSSYVLMQFLYYFSYNSPGVIIRIHSGHGKGA